MEFLAGETLKRARRRILPYVFSLALPAQLYRRGYKVNIGASNKTVTRYKFYKRNKYGKKRFII
jgi:hypothetical protein